MELMRQLLLALALAVIAHGVTAEANMQRTINAASLTSPLADFPPYAWIDKNTGEENGVAKYVLEKILQENNRSVHWHSADIGKPKKFSATMAKVTSGEIDLVASIFKPYPQPEYLYFPEYPVYTLEVRLYVNRLHAFHYQGIHTLQNKVGAAIKHFDASIIDDPEFTKAAAQSLTIKGVNNIPEILSLLMSEKIDYAILPKITTESLLHYYKIKDQIQYLEPVFATVPVYYAFSKKSKELALVGSFNNYLKALKLTGELQLLEQRFMREYINYRNTLPTEGLKKNPRIETDNSPL